MGGEEGATLGSQPIVANPGTTNFLVSFLPDGTPIYTASEAVERSANPAALKAQTEVQLAYRFRPRWRLAVQLGYGTFARQTAAAIDPQPGRYYWQRRWAQRAWTSGLALDHLGALGPMPRMVRRAGNQRPVLVAADGNGMAGYGHG